MTAPRPRERVVLARRRGARTMRTRTDVLEQTAVGDAVVRALVRTQLRLAIRLAVVAIVLFGSVPAVFALVPGAAEASLWGVRVAWIVLGVLAYVALLVVGWVFVRQAERNEDDFTELVDR
nr:hypothetical protein [Rhodococcus rhodnii]